MFAFINLLIISLEMNKYQLLQKVGSGNFSSVHLVRNIETGQTAAMKLMKTHQNIALKQAYFLKNFDHPNIIRLFDFEQDPSKGQTKIVLEYLPENTLELYEQQKFGLRQEQVKCILFQAALGLAYVHEKGIIHRDIKPQNILIDKRKAEIKLIDFGLAVSIEKVATDYVATRWYRAPQNLLGTKQYTCLIDVFSLACVIVQLYLGNPLFPGADNLDQLYRIFNILGEPTEASWPAGFNKYKQLGFKNDPARKLQKTGQETFSLRSLLKACSQGLASLLERMLILNPKKRITTREIVLDPYFHDVKTIVPPVIYMRFQKDQILKKSNNKQFIENNNNLLTGIKNKFSTRQAEVREEITSSTLNPNSHQTTQSNCALINFAVSPRKDSVLEEEPLSKQIDFKKIIGMHVMSPKQKNWSLKPPQQQPSSNFQHSTLAFRGFNPIKNNKISVKQNRKNQESHSQHKERRDYSIGSNKGGKEKYISSSIDISNKFLNQNNRFVQPMQVQRKMTNDRDYRTPEIYKKSLDKAEKVLYYFQGEKPSGKTISPLKMIMPCKQQNNPVQSSIRMQQTNNSFLQWDSRRMTRNNSAINPPSLRTPVQQMRPIMRPIEREKVSYPGIYQARIQRDKSIELESKPESLYAKESIYMTSKGRPAYEKLKVITNVVSGLKSSYLQNKSRNDRSYDHSTANISRLQETQGSNLQQRPQMLQFKQKGSQVIHQFIPSSQGHKPYHFEIVQKQPPYFSNKLKQCKSAEHKLTTETVKYFTTRTEENRDSFSIGQFKPLRTNQRQDYRQPRIDIRKNQINKFNSADKFKEVFPSPRQKNININLNLSIVQAEGNRKPDLSIKRSRV